MCAVRGHSSIAEGFCQWSSQCGGVCARVFAGLSGSQCVTCMMIVFWWSKWQKWRVGEWVRDLYNGAVILILSCFGIAAFVLVGCWIVRDHAFVMPYMDHNFDFCAVFVNGNNMRRHSACLLWPFRSVTAPARTVVLVRSVCLMSTQDIIRSVIHHFG